MDVCSRMRVAYLRNQLKYRNTQNMQILILLGSRKFSSKLITASQKGCCWGFYCRCRASWNLWFCGWRISFIITARFSLFIHERKNLKRIQKDSYNTIICKAITNNINWKQLTKHWFKLQQLLKNIEKNLKKTYLKITFS